jgi:glycine/sarcosine/betaine reductase complex component A
MDLQNQQRVIDAVEQYGADNVVLLLGTADAEGAGIYAETVTTGDPTYAGPLTGVSLRLPVYHMLDAAIKAEVDPAKWEEQMSMVEMVLDSAALADAVAQVREQSDGGDV